MTKTKLKRCACGEVPEEILVSGAHIRGALADAVPSCCRRWSAKFYTGHIKLSREEAQVMAETAWNDAPRGGEEVEKLYEIIDKLRGQLQNCINHLGAANRRDGRDKYAEVIESANKTLYETLMMLSANAGP